jgi:glucokinase
MKNKELQALSRQLSALSAVVMTNQLYVGVDVGAATIKAGVVDDAGHPRSAITVPTEPTRGSAYGLARMCEAVRSAVRTAGVEMHQVTAIGVAAPGLLDIPAGVILETANLPGWRDVRVREHVAAAFGVPTAFQNDANAAAYGEYWAGAGRGCRSLLLLTLGTGIGGGIVLNDRVLEGAHSHGGEVGHVVIEMTNPRQCGCGHRGCLEAYASASAVVARTREALNKGSPSSLRKVPPNELSARHVFEAAAAGDALATGLVEETAYYLAMGTANLMHVLDPEVVVYGGGMAAAGEGFLERVRAHVRKLAFPVPAARTHLCYASLGNDAGFIGAAACARQLVRPIP